MENNSVNWQKRTFRMEDVWNGHFQSDKCRESYKTLIWKWDKTNNLITKESMLCKYFISI